MKLVMIDLISFVLGETVRFSKRISVGSGALLMLTSLFWNLYSGKKSQQQSLAMKDFKKGIFHFLMTWSVWFSVLKLTNTIPERSCNELFPEMNLCSSYWSSVSVLSSSASISPTFSSLTSTEFPNRPWLFAWIFDSRVLLSWISFALLLCKRVNSWISYVKLTFLTSISSPYAFCIFIKSVIVFASYAMSSSPESMTV